MVLELVRITLLLLVLFMLMIIIVFMMVLILVLFVLAPMMVVEHPLEEALVFMNGLRIRLWSLSVKESKIYLQCRAVLTIRHDEY